MQTVQKITPECQSDIINSLNNQFTRGNTKKLIFRRCGKIVNMVKPVYKKVTPTSTHVLHGSQEITMDEMKKNGQIDCAEFYGFTTPHAIRTELVCTLNKPICFRSNTYCQPNIGMRHQSQSHLYEVITPLEGDLLCIWLSKETINDCISNGKAISADAWFIASEQFLRAYTLITEKWHSSFDKLIPKNTPLEERENALRKKMFSGNNLMTNTWLKHKLALEQSNLPPMSEKESEEKYWHLRSEPASRNWVDVYAALVLMARYGEAPGELNLPNNGGDGPKRNCWNLPIGFLENYYLKIEGMESTTVDMEEASEEEIEVQIVIEIPKNTKVKVVNVALAKAIAADWGAETD